MKNNTEIRLTYRVTMSHEGEFTQDQLYELITQNLVPNLYFEDADAEIEDVWLVNVE